MKLISAQPHNTRINRCWLDWEFRVELEGKYRHDNYEQRGELYRADHGDLVSFFSYSKPGNGFCGAHFNITMIDGSHRTLIGPWSSRPGVINTAFPDRDPAVSCVWHSKRIALHVRKSALERLGMKLVKHQPWKGSAEVYWLPAEFAA